MTSSNQTVDLTQLRIDRGEKPRDPRNMKKRLAMIGAALGLILLGLSVVSRSSKVKVAKITKMSSVQADALLNAAGYIVARSKAEISPKAVGRVSWLRLEEGQKVKKGQMVARLESRELIAQQKQIRASLEQAKRDRDRFKALIEDQAVSRQAYENAETQVQSLQAQFEYYQEQIRNTEIFAPISGTVTVKKAYLGETVAPQGYGGAGSAGATFAVIVDMDSLEMEADISEQNLGKLAQDQPAVITLDAYPQKNYKARLRQIVPTADRQKGSVNVKIELLEKDDRILPEMSARVTFIHSEATLENQKAERIFVPKSALVDVDGTRGVLVVDDASVARFTPITLGTEKDNQVEVVSDLGGDTVVIEEGSSPRRWKRVQKVKVDRE